jgi:hypothetical protein
MTDLAPAVDPGQHTSAPPLDAPQIAAMREAWIFAGHAAERFDQAASGQEIDPVDRPDDVDPSDLASPNSPSLTPAQAEEMAAALRSAGMDPAAIAKALKDDGFDAEPAPDTRTDDQKDYDRAFPAPSPHDYRVHYMGLTPAGTDASAIAELNATATTWASEIGLPVGVAEATIERAIAVGQQVGGMDASARQLWQIEQRFDFERIAGGPEQAAAKMTLAAQALIRATGPFTAALKSTGALDDAFVILNLAHQGERMAARS